MDMDLLLTLAGLVLLMAGLLGFLFGRSRHPAGEGRNNVFEAFGIKLDVANPSILLIMFGVVMMLTPRFVPLGDDMPPPDPAPLASTSENSGGAVSDTSATHPQSVQSSVPATVETEPTTPVAPVSKPAEPVLQKPPQPAKTSGVAAAEAEPEPTPVETAPVPFRVGVFTEAFHYDGASESVLRSKMQQDLRRLVAAALGSDVQVEHPNPGFRAFLRRDGLGQLCKRTRMDRLLLADLMPVSIESSVESANWPEMRYTAIDCASGQSSQSGWLRMEPVVRDRYPVQQSMLRTARRFVFENRHLLLQQQ